MRAPDFVSLSSLAALCAWALLLGPHVQAQAQEPAARVVFLLPELDATTLTQLNEALLAQLSLVGAELLVRQDSTALAGATMTARVSAAQALAEQEGAQIVMWIETERGGRWLVHVLDSKQERVAVRPLDAREGMRPAAIEAVGVIAREASREVIVAPQIEVKAEPQPEPAPVAVAPPAPESAAPAPSQTPVLPNPSWRFAAGYVGSDFAKQMRFVHGVALDGRFQLAIGVFGGLGVEVIERVRPRSAPFSLGRFPFEAFAGYRVSPVEGVWVEGELGLRLEALTREADSVMDTALATADTTEDTTRVLVALSPRGRVEYKPWQSLGIYAAIGVDTLLTNLSYEALAQGPSTEIPLEVERSELLRPHWIRPVIELGLALYP